MLIISYHQDHYLADALKSVKQNFNLGDEIVIALLDSSEISIENTRNLLQEQALSARLVKFDNPPFTTVKALQHMLPLMTSDSVVLLSADDALGSGYKHVTLQHLAGNTHPVVLNSALILADENLDAVGNAYPRWSSHGWLNRLWLFFENPGKAPGSVIPRQAVLDSDFMKVDPRCMIEDYPLWLLLSHSARFRRVRQPVVRYRQHPNSLSRKVDNANFCWSIGYCIGLAEARANNVSERLLARFGRRRWYRQTNIAMRHHVEDGRRSATLRFG